MLRYKHPSAWHLHGGEDPPSTTPPAMCTASVSSQLPLPVYGGQAALAPGLQKDGTRRYQKGRQAAEGPRLPTVSH